MTSYGETPDFSCKKGGSCEGFFLGNCNDCPNRPDSAWEYMSALARKYIRDEYAFTYEKSLFSHEAHLKGVGD